MYPDNRLDILSHQSKSNFYKLLRDLHDHTCCLALGAGASATVGLPTWTRLLKRICHCYFEEWALGISSGKATFDRPPTNISVALANSYELYESETKNPELKDEIEHIFDNFEFWQGNKKASPEETALLGERMNSSIRLIHRLQDGFMDTIMSNDLTITAQMIRNHLRAQDWNYLIRKSLYMSYEDNPFVLRISNLYLELIELTKLYNIVSVINYNYDDTFYHALTASGLSFKNYYQNTNKTCKQRIFYPHGYIPMKGGVITPIVLCESDYQNQIYAQNLWSNSIQTALFSLSSVIFVGLSLNDSNIRRLINMCSSARSHMHYAFLPCSGENEYSIMHDSLFDADLYRLGIRVIRYPRTSNHDVLPLLIHCLRDID